MSENILIQMLEELKKQTALLEGLSKPPTAPKIPKEVVDLVEGMKATAKGTSLESALEGMSTLFKGKV